MDNLLMKNIKSTVLLFALASTSNAFSCGDYLARAQVVMKNGASSLVINPDTKSEINLKVEFKESAKLSPYIGRFIETLVRMEEAMDATRGEVVSLGSIKVLVPDPLANSKGTSMKLINKIECKKISL